MAAAEAGKFLREDRGGQADLLLRWARACPAGRQEAVVSVGCTEPSGRLLLESPALKYRGRALEIEC
jgi:hypothetical protein